MTKPRVGSVLDRHVDLTSQIIAAAIEVHEALGPGLLESAYEQCLVLALESRSIPVAKQVELPVEFRGIKVQPGYRMDLVVSGAVVVEVKTVDALLPVHDAQLLTYLKLSGLRVGLLLNFNVPILKQGIRRKVL